MIGVSQSMMHVLNGKTVFTFYRPPTLYLLLKILKLLKLLGVYKSAPIVVLLV